MHILQLEKMAGSCLVFPPAPRLIAPLPFALSLSHIGCVPDGVRKFDGRCNLNADLDSLRQFLAQCRSAHYTQSPELGESSQKLTALSFASRRHRFAALAGMQRFVYFSRHPQLMQDYG